MLHHIASRVLGQRHLRLAGICSAVVIRTTIRNFFTGFIFNVYLLSRTFKLYEENTTLALFICFMSAPGTAYSHHII